MNFTIKDLEAITGIKAHTIRIWEQRYHFLKPSRTNTNIRRYSNDELKDLLTVTLLNKYGYRMARIDEMSAEERKKAALELTGIDANHDHLVNRMIEFMVDVRPVEFERLLNTHIDTVGIEQTISELIFYFLQKVGVLWHADYIRPFQEHIVSNIIRQKILSAIDALPLADRAHPVFSLFLPQDEYHEIGLLYVYYLLRKNNLTVTYLGADVPLKDLQALSNFRVPDYIYLHLTVFPRRHNLDGYLSTLSTTFASSKILLSGSATGQIGENPANVIQFQSLAELKGFIQSI